MVCVRPLSYTKRLSSAASLSTVGSKSMNPQIPIPSHRSSHLIPPGPCRGSPLTLSLSHILSKRFKAAVPGHLYSGQSLKERVIAISKSGPRGGLGLPANRRPTCQVIPVELFVRHLPGQPTTSTCVGSRLAGGVITYLRGNGC